MCASMCIGPEGDLHGVPAGECAVRMARAGADVVGVNCRFDPAVSLETMRLMKAALGEAGLKPHLMVQTLGVWTPDVKQQGYVHLPEFPFGAYDHTQLRTASRLDDVIHHIPNTKSQRIHSENSSPSMYSYTCPVRVVVPMSK